MNIIEARRPRHLIIRVDRGEELPAALSRALDEIEARAGWIEGAGSLEAAELAGADSSSRTRRIEGPCEVVSLTGSVATQGGVSAVRLWATLARETELGLQLAAGELIWGRAYALELMVTAFDDVGLARVPDERTGQALLAAQAGALAAPAAESAPRAAPEPSAQTAPTPPPRPARPQQEEESYPEVGDLVNHFHFGECEVIGSDGERIRLRQERDGRVREVALTMLKIEGPTTVPESGKRHFRLSRKH